MSTDYSPAIEMLVPDSFVFKGNNDHTFIVIHETGDSSFYAQDTARYFQDINSNTTMKSAHFIVGRDGVVVQCVREADGAGGNCCPEIGHATFLDAFLHDNFNLHSISIEHASLTPDNSLGLTDVQAQASFKLVKHLCDAHFVPKRYPTNDGQGGIIGHHDLDPISRARCPGNYPWNELWVYLKGSPVIDHKQKSAYDEWSTFVPDAPTDTEIFQEWYRDYTHGIFHGMVLSHEVTRTTWDGIVIVKQYFQGGHYEYSSKTNRATWYPAR